jgi:hypothetical protein
LRFKIAAESPSRGQSTSARPIGTSGVPASLVFGDVSIGCWQRRATVIRRR